MIDIITVVHRNYRLLDKQVAHWNTIAGPHRLIIGDNTPGDKEPVSHPNYHSLPLLSCFDGESHGLALDHLIRNVATSDIVGIVDTDFFWLDTKILDRVLPLFEAGHVCVGAEGMMEGWDRLNGLHPTRTGYMAPVCWGMFVLRKLAAEETFVVTSQEGSQIRETGWRLRERIIDGKMPNTVFPAFQAPAEDDPNPLVRDWYRRCWLYGERGKPIGIHLTHGSLGHPTADHVEAVIARAVPHG